jgi:serine/threonine-protein kinase
MSPEQVLGDGVLDRRTDLYSLGCVAFWLLTGRAVFEASTPMKVMMAHAQSPPGPPSDVAELSVPADLDAVVMACLAKDPEERPESADVLDDRLAACEQDHPWSQDQAREWWDLHAPESEPGAPTSTHAR